jgi:hemerythrin
MSTEWTPELIVHHDELDRQHAELFRKIRDAVAALDEARAVAELAVRALADAVLAHFATEEQLMDEALYPDRARHRAAHELFAADLAQVQEALRVEGPTPSVAAALSRRVPEWLAFHIRVNDAPLAAHLARRRREPGDVHVRRGGDGRRPS